MKYIALFGSIPKEESFPNLLNLINQLLKKGVEIFIDQDFHTLLTKKNLENIPPITILNKNSWENIDFIISFGGDGTFLRTVHKTEQYKKPILAINGGHLGFLTELDATETLLYIDRLLNNDFDIEERHLLSVFSNSNLIGYAFNEIVIQRKDSGSLLKIETYINNNFLATYSADGLIIAAPSGSTAYSMSANGPIVPPQCPILLITPIAPHSLTMRPLVIPDNEIIQLRVDYRNDSFSLVRDGELSIHALDEIITIQKSKKTIPIIRLGNTSFYKTIRSKLMWGQPLR